MRKFQCLIIVVTLSVRLLQAINTTREGGGTLPFQSMATSSALLSGENTEEWFLSSFNSDGSTVSHNDVNANKVSSFNVVGDLKISCSLQLGDDFLATSCSAEFCRLSGYAMDEILGQDLQFLRCNLRKAKL